MDKVAYAHPFPQLEIDRNLGNYISRIGAPQRVQHLICLRNELLTKILKSGDSSMLSEEHWNYFLLAINEHPTYQVRNRKQIALHDFHSLAEQFWEDHGERRIETLMCWGLWLIQRDLHPLYYLVKREYPVVRSYEEAQLLSGLPSTAYVESETLQQTIEIKKARKERLEILILNGRGDSTEAVGLRKSIEKKYPNEYIYGNCFDDMEIYLKQDFLDPKTLLMGQYIGIRDWYDIDFGTYDRIAKAKIYIREPKRTEAYSKMTAPDIQLKFPEGENVPDIPITPDNRYLISLMGINRGQAQRHVSMGEAIEFDAPHGMEKRKVRTNPPNASSPVSSDHAVKAQSYLNLDQLPMSQAKKQAEIIGNYVDDSQDEDWDDDYFNSETYWVEQAQK